MAIPARTLMIQGATSNAGKSALVAGLARIFARRGVRVAPFKAQNMALSVSLLRDGPQIGTAQAFQARAAGIEPTADMNPILLKPSSKTGSQVFVEGYPVKNMTVSEYHDFQPVAWEHAKAALDRLRDEYELVLIEGAGSPAEINLRDHDIANMAVALHADSPVLLVVDIERGGAFAHIVGTMELLSEDERSLVAGFVINRFRGDESLLDPGLDYLQERYGVPVVGVVPYLSGWQGDEEDSLALESIAEVPDADIVVGVLRLPYFASGNEVVRLSREEDVAIRWIDRPGHLEGIDALVLPATTAPEEAREWLSEGGLLHGLRDVLKSVPLLDLGIESAEPVLVDRGEVRLWVDSLREKKGLPRLSPAEPADPIDVLADVLEEALDIEALFGLVGIDPVGKRAS